MDLRGISLQAAGLLIVVVILAAVAAYGWARPAVIVERTITATGAPVTVTAAAPGAASPLAQLKVGIIVPIDESDFS